MTYTATVVCSTCDQEFNYRGEGFLCEECAASSMDEIKRNAAQEIVDRACGNDPYLAELIPSATRDEVLDWIEREYLAPEGGEEGDPACPMCDKPIGVLPDDGGCDCLVDYQEGEL